MIRSGTPGGIVMPNSDQRVIEGFSTKYRSQLGQRNLLDRIRRMHIDPHRVETNRVRHSRTATTGSRLLHLVAFHQTTAVGHVAIAVDQAGNSHSRPPAQHLHGNVRFALAVLFGPGLGHVHHRVRSFHANHGLRGIRSPQRTSHRSRSLPSREHAHGPPQTQGRCHSTI